MPEKSGDANSKERIFGLLININKPPPPLPSSHHDSKFDIYICICILTGHIVPARFVHLAGEELEADDGVNNDDEENEESDVEEGYHRS